MKKLRVVQVGTGPYTHSFHTMSAMRALPEYYDVVGVCEPNEKDRAIAMGMEAYRGLQWLQLEDVLQDHSLDAIIVETGELDQGKTALLFAEAGFNIHVDKPCGDDVAVFEKLVETVQRKHLAFQVGYMLRYNPAVVRLMETIRAGKLGEIISFEAHMSPHRYNDSFCKELLQYMRGGMTYYLGCHLIDLMYLIQGEPEEILPYNVSTGTRDYEGLDYGFVVYRYKHGMSFIKTSASEVSGDTRRQLVIIGTKGTVEIKPFEHPIEVNGIFCANTVEMRLSYASRLPFEQRSEVVSFPPFGRYADMMIDFARIVNGEGQNPYPPEHELAVFQLLLKSCGLH